MTYFQTDDIPSYEPGKPKPHLTLISPSGEIRLFNVKSHKIREYFKNTYCKVSNGKKIWRAGLTKLGYTINNNEI